MHLGPIKRENGASMEVAFEKRMPAPWPSGQATLPVHVQATVTHSGSRYVVRGEARAMTRAVCDRCLEEVELPIVAAFEEAYRRRTDRPERMDDEWTPYDGESEPEDEGDEETLFEGDSFELDGVVRQHLLLAFPPKVLCREDCRGMCPACGQNRNDGPCECRTDDVDPRLAGLARLLEREE